MRSVVSPKLACRVFRSKRRKNHLPRQHTTLFMIPSRSSLERRKLRATRLRKRRVGQTILKTHTHRHFASGMCYFSRAARPFFGVPGGKELDKKSQEFSLQGGVLANVDRQKGGGGKKCFVLERALPGY